MYRDLPLLRGEVAGVVFGTRLLALSEVLGMKPYYEHAGITIYHGDCREILPTLPKVDLVLTDPPYGIGMSMNPFRQKFEKSNWDKFAPDGTVISEVVGAADHSILWGGNYFDLPPN